ncbi:MAG: hypothetical protein K6C35_02000 [Eubacterium sp.]|nr:hypothetical protein [Eubacterium sp.]SEF42247.1 hypothetical protein SAMN04487934_101112 [Eubacterium ruminantium]
MFRIINQYLANVNINTNPEIKSKVDIYLHDREDIEKYCINENFNKYIVDIRMKNFSVDNADMLFRDFITHISYAYSAMHVRYNEGVRVRYRYVTSKEDKSAVYMDIVIS